MAARQRERVQCSMQGVHREFGEGVTAGIGIPMKMTMKKTMLRTRSTRAKDDRDLQKL